MRNPFLRVMRSTGVEWEHKTGENSFNQPVFAPAVPLQCRWRVGPQRVRTSTGLEVLATDVLWCPPETELLIEDRLHFPDGRTATLRDIQRAPDHRGQIYAVRGACWMVVLVWLLL